MSDGRSVEEMAAIYERQSVNGFTATAMSVLPEGGGQKRMLTKIGEACMVVVTLGAVCYCIARHGTPTGAYICV